MLLIPSNVNLFIGNLDYSVREAQLEELFSECGEVSSCKVVIDKMTDRSRGFAFVEMADDDQGRKAIETLNGRMLKSRAINVSEARPREERPARDGGNFRSRRD